MTIQTAVANAAGATPEAYAATHRALPAGRYDLVIVGAGSAGLSAVSVAPALGARVALLERERFGGDCLYTGCVPSKALLHVAHTLAQVRRAQALGLAVSVGPVGMAPVAARVQRVIDQVYAHNDAPELFEAQGVAVGIGDVRFTSRTTLAFNGHPLEWRHVLLCTGSRPKVPALPGLGEVSYLTNESVFDLQRLPGRLVVIGGGPVGCELAQAYARLGALVTLLQRADRLLPRDEPDASALLRAALEADGITVHTGATVESVTECDGAKLVRARVGGELVETGADEILVATGRLANVEGLDLAAAGIMGDALHGIQVDDALRTTNPRVFAAGDVVGGARYTHAAALHARIAVRNALAPGSQRLDQRVMPWATFTEPEVAHVGLTEAQARARRGEATRVYTQPFAQVDRAITDDATTGWVKLVASAKGELLGAQIVGIAAGEAINELALALDRRMTLPQLARVTHVYPTLSLAIQQAAAQDSLARTRASRLIRMLVRLKR